MKAVQKKVKLYTLAMIACAFSSHSFASAPSLNNSGFTVGAAAVSNSNGVGYSVSASWQMNPYAVFELGGKSRLANEDIKVSDVLSVEDLAALVEAGYEYPTSFSPRLTDLNFGVNFQYPMTFDGFELAPVLGANVMQLRMETVDLYKKGSGTGTGTGSSGNSSGSTSGDKVGEISWPTVQAIRLSIGLRVLNGDHVWNIGYAGYSMDDKWSGATFDDASKGGFLKYNYYLTNHASVMVGWENRGVLGEEALSMGFDWRF